MSARNKNDELTWQEIALLRQAFYNYINWHGWPRPYPDKLEQEIDSVQRKLSLMLEKTLPR